MSKQEISGKERKIVGSEEQPGDSKEGKGKRNIEDIVKVESQRLVCKNILLEGAAWRLLIR